MGYTRVMTNNDAFADAVRALTAGRRVVWLTGAGISVASGLAPYRKSRDAVWSNFITDWGTIERFHDDPVVWYREFWWKAHGALVDRSRVFAPNAGHLAVTRFLQRFENHMLITQNIDRLHLAASAPAARTIEIHGRHDVFCCGDPWCRVARQAVEGVVYDLERGPPTCTECGHVMRPLVLLFDEMYDSHPAYRAREARQWLHDADVVIFVGTSFSVGITALALQTAVQNRTTVVNVNVEAIDELGFVNVLGPSEETLPALADAAGV